MKKFICLLLAFSCLISLAACGSKKPKEYDVPALFQSILNQVQFADPLTDAGAAAPLYFPDLPEGTEVKLYLGSGYHADVLGLLTLPSDQEVKAGKTAVDSYLTQVRNQFANYIPAELGKIDSAYVWEYGKYILLCITDDISSVKTILDHADDPTFQLPGGNKPTTPTEPANPTNPTVPTEPTQPTEPTNPTEPTQPTEPTNPTEPTQPTEPTNPTEPTQPTEPTNPTEPTQPTEPTDPTQPTRPDGYPAINSQSGTYKGYGDGGIIIVDNAAYEIHGYHDGTANVYAGLINKVADALAGKTQVYSLLIPTAFGVSLPDDIQAKYPGYPNQGQLIDKVISKYNSNVTSIRCFDNLMAHRNEYLYFRTDHHWNGTGAYYAYEAFCETMGFQPYTLEQRTEVKFDGFLGTLYQHTGNPSALLPADTVYAYKPYSKNASMTYYDNQGNGTAWPIIVDVSGWNAGSKYSTFAAGDQPLAVFKNPSVTDGSVCIIVKESYGNALMPYLVDHYSTIYEIDYRYWKGDIVAYAQQVGADHLIFANNVAMVVSSSIGVANLSTIIK